MIRQHEIFLPKKIYDLVADEACKTDDVGMSGASIFIYENKILKVQGDNAEAENEYRMMQYLQDKIPVPQVYAYEKEEGKSYLLMSKCMGEMACSHTYMSHPAMLCKLLADGLKSLWSIDISDCRSDQRLPHKLAQARYYVENGLVDLDNVQPDTFGKDGFKNPMELLEWLYGHMPEEDLVLSHGDFCLPNIFGMDDKVSGYIDLGRMGIADKWCDIAICYRSLSNNYSGKYDFHIENEYLGYDDAMFFDELGMEPNWEKIRYYILLDELF